MKTQTENDKIILEIYRRMYKEATPSADIDKIIKSGEGKKPDWFMKYYLLQSRQEEIIEEVLDKFKIKGYMRKRFITEIILGSAPNGSEVKIESKLKEEVKVKKNYGLVMNVEDKTQEVEEKLKEEIKDIKKGLGLGTCPKCHTLIDNSSMVIKEIIRQNKLSKEAGKQETLKQVEKIIDKKIKINKDAIKFYKVKGNAKLKLEMCIQELEELKQKLKEKK